VDHRRSLSIRNIRWNDGPGHEGGLFPRPCYRKKKKESYQAFALRNRGISASPPLHSSSESFRKPCRISCNDTHRLAFFFPFLWQQKPMPTAYARGAPLIFESCLSRSVSAFRIHFSVQGLSSAAWLRRSRPSTRYPDGG
jgi:hypothetical protein